MSATLIQLVYTTFALLIEGLDSTSANVIQVAYSMPAISRLPRSLK